MTQILLNQEAILILFGIFLSWCLERTSQNIIILQKERIEDSEQRKYYVVINKIS